MSSLHEYPAADVLRRHLDPDDLEALGVRPEGGLNWNPDDKPAPTPPVEAARLRTLARRKNGEHERRLRAAHDMSRFLAGVT